MLNENTAVVTLCTFLVLSRIGSWMFELSVATQIQAKIPEEHRGQNAGVQDSLQNLFAIG
jgi:hypothetical protein